MIRVFDLVIALIGFSFLSPIFLFIYFFGLLFKLDPFFVQIRVGKDEKFFKLYKFRTMKKDTANLPTHLIDENSLTFFGPFLRKTKLDELPQLWNVLIGDMSLVGPRPCLTNQKELILRRRKFGLYTFKPGITGLAQIRNIDMADPEKLSKVDLEMMSNLTLLSYLRYIFLTIAGNGAQDKINKIK